MQSPTKNLRSPCPPFSCEAASESGSICLEKGHLMLYRVSCPLNFRSKPARQSSATTTWLLKSRYNGSWSSKSSCHSWTSTRAALHLPCLPLKRSSQPTCTAKSSILSQKGLGLRLKWITDSDISLIRNIFLSFSPKAKD